ncbi:hypothetical protein SELMODRAFT_107796, partial [Selaginella moellendorffii]
MECLNKDDAVKAVDLAEKKFMLHDLAAAKDFCVRALQLDPGLERGKQMLAVVEVHAAAAIRHHSLIILPNDLFGIGDHDWYAILGVDPRADDDSIRTQYRKMARLVHPDKNRMNGAEEAIKLVNEAMTILSDKNKKMIYDSIRSSLPSTSNDASAPPPRTPPPPQPPPYGTPTFVAQCPFCMAQWWYYKTFENYVLLCACCLRNFIVVDFHHLAWGYPGSDSWY